MRPYPTLATPDRSSKVNAPLAVWRRTELVEWRSPPPSTSAVPNSSKGSARMLSKQPLRHGNGVPAGTYRMHPDTPHPTQRKHGGQSGRGVIPQLGRPWTSIRTGEEPNEKPLAG